jgi:tRNA A37 methylthiotransferase MiaB
LRRQDFVGRTMSVLIESTEKEGWHQGHTTNFLPVLVKGAELKQNDLVSVRLKENTPEGLIGELL